MWTESGKLAASMPVLHDAFVMGAWVQMLATLSRWVDEVPPSQQSLRYGNPAYRCVAAHPATCPNCD